MVVAALGLLMAVAHAAPASAQSSVRVQRVGGADRYETGVATVLEGHYDRCAEQWEWHHDSEQECRDEADIINWTVVRGDSFADALSAASVDPGPILITRRDRIPPAFDRLEGRLSGEVIIVGDEDVIDQSVEDAIVGRFASGASRVAGPTRYDTAVEAAQVHRQLYGESSFPFFEVVIVNGENWPDALTASSLTGIMRVALPTHATSCPTWSPTISPKARADR